MSDAMPKLLNHGQARMAAKALAVVRAAIGLGAFLVPGRLLRPWIGAANSENKGAELLGRSLAARDLALAAGPILSMRHDTPVRGWIEGGLLADTGDAVATLVGFGHLPKRTRWLVLAMTLGAVAVGAIVAPAVDHADEG